MSQDLGGGVGKLKHEVKDIGSVLMYDPRTGWRRV